MIGEVPRVPDAQQYPERLRRFTEIVAQILNSLEEGGFIIRGADGTYTLNLPGGLSVSDGATTVTAVSLVKFITNAVVTDAGGGEADVDITGTSGGLDPISAIYPTFAPTGDSDEFSSGSFSGWTAVNSGSHNPTITQTNNRLSLLSPGGDAAAELHAYMKSTTVNANDYIECGLQILASNQLTLAGLVMSDGTTYGAGTNVCLHYSPFETNAIREFNGTGFNALVGQSSLHILDLTRASDMFLRMKYLGSNNWEGYISCDGISWLLALSWTTTLTPTKIGFFVSTWGSAGQAIFNFRYFKHTS